MEVEPVSEELARDAKIGRVHQDHVVGLHGAPRRGAALQHGVAYARWRRAAAAVSACGVGAVIVEAAPRFPGPRLTEALAQLANAVRGRIRKGLTKGEVRMPVGTLVEATEGRGRALVHACSHVARVGRAEQTAPFGLCSAAELVEGRREAQVAGVCAPQRLERAVRRQIGRDRCTTKPKGEAEPQHLAQNQRNAVEDRPHARGGSADAVRGLLGLCGHARTSAQAACQSVSEMG